MDMHAYACISMHIQWYPCICMHMHAHACICTSMHMHASLRNSRTALATSYGLARAKQNHIAALAAGWMSDLSRYDYFSPEIIDL